MKRSKNRPAVANLPEEIIFYNILTRVPDKSLNQFRCVCKQWSNLPDDPLFKSSYSHHRTSNLQSERGFICCKKNYFFSGDLNKLATYWFSFLDIDNKKRKQIPFQQPEYDDEIRNHGAYVSIIDSIDGLLLLRFLLRGTLSNRCYVYNLASGCWIRICTHSEDMGTSDLAMDDYSLAYDPIISRYKVVGHKDKYFYIFTVADGEHSWRRVSKPSRYTQLLGKPVYVDYALHWICRKNKNTDYGDILRLDASKEKVSIIKLRVRGSSTSRSLLEMGGLLWFIHSFQANYDQLKLWYLKKNHKGGFMDHEWVAKCSINLETGICPQLRCCWSREPVMIVTDPKCRIIFTFVDKNDTDNKCIYSYDMELQHWDLIHAGPVCYDKKSDEPEFHYWYDNKNTLCPNNVRINRRHTMAAL